MATTPTPTPVIPQNWIATWGSFLKVHERLLVILIASFLLFRTGQGIENVILKHDQKAADIAANTVKSDETANKDLQRQLDKMRVSANEQTAQFKADIQSKIDALAAQKKKDSTSTPAEIDSRWKGLLPLKPGSITQLNPLETAVTNDAANQTVQALEELPVLKTQVADLTQEIVIDQKLIILQDNTITGLNKQIIDEKKSHDADVKLAKAQNKHSFWKGFKIGVIVGAIGVEAVRVWAGHP